MGRVLNAFFIAGLFLPWSASAQGSDSPVQVEILTELGTIRVELFPERAPNTVSNFLKYVDDGFFDSIIFHRVIPGFMIQGGGFTKDRRRKPTRSPITSTT